MNQRERKEKENEELEEIVGDVMRVMEYAKQKFGPRFRFLWNVQLMNDSLCWIENEVHSYNADINTKDLERFMLFISNKHYALSVLESMVANGDKMVVTCINEKKQPKKLKERIRFGGVYRINKAYISKKGRVVYRLEGVND